MPSRPPTKAQGLDVRRPPNAGHLTTPAGRRKGIPPARQTHPDFPPPEIHPLFDEVPPPAPVAALREQLRATGTAVELVDVQGTPHRVDPVPREPGDEARTIRVLTPVNMPSVAPATVADCGHWYECDCEEYRRDWECRHVFALIRAGILTDPLAGRPAVGRGRGGDQW